MSGPPLLDPDMQPFRMPMNKEHCVFVCAA